MKNVSSVKKAGLSIIELIIVLLIMAILFSFLLPRYYEIRRDAVKSSEEAVIGALQEALDIYVAEHKGAFYKGNPFDILGVTPQNKTITGGAELVPDGTIWKVLRMQVLFGPTYYFIFCPHVGDGQGTAWRYTYYSNPPWGRIDKVYDYGH